MKASEDLNEKFSTSRRGFIKGLLGTGSAVALYGCSKNDSPDVYLPGESTDDDDLDIKDAKFVYGTSAHNCGGRCIIRGQVVNGKIVRFLTDENVIGYRSTGAAGAIDQNDPNCTQSRACSRCRSYRFRLYHAGRLRYPMKQTKARGDLDGFVRISWDEALDAMAEKYKLTYDKYGPDAIYNNYASAAGGSQSASSWGTVFNHVGGYQNYWGSYSTHQWRYCVNGYSGFPMYVNSTGQGYSTQYTGNSYHANCNDIGKYTKNVVMYGSNYITTYHQYSYSTIRAIEEMKKRDNTAKAIFVGPELVDQGITVADEWVRIKPYTDPALFMGMMYHLITNTWNSDGSLRPKADRLLDVDYLDTMVYGFFDSPEYWIDQSTGQIYNQDPTNAPYNLTQEYIPIKRGITWNATTSAITTHKYNEIKVDWTAPEPGPDSINTRADGNTTYIFDYVQKIRRVDAVPAGQSLAAYVMGTDTHLSNADYSQFTDGAGTLTNYIANEYASNFISPDFNGKRASRCSYKNSGTRYKTKNDFLTPKTPAWASEITGIPVAKIIELAEFYANPTNHPIYSEWCGGLQKQADGVNNLIILQMFLLVCKNWGLKGGGWGRGVDASYDRNTGVSTSLGNPAPTKPQTPTPSCTAWHNAVKVAYSNELKSNQYTARWVPDYNDIGSVYMDDGGTKALLAWDRNPTNGKVLDTVTDTDNPTHSYYKWLGAPATTSDAGAVNSATYAGFRFITNCGGNILVNQHECSNDLVDMWENIPAYTKATTDQEKADALCIVSFDNYLSPTPRWSDYVLPAATTWEQPTVIQPAMGSGMYIPTVSAPPGQSLSQFEFQVGFLKKYGQKYDGNTDRATTFTWGKENMTVEEKVMENFATLASNSSSPFYRKSWEEFLQQPYLPGVQNTTEKTDDSDLWADLDTYLKGNVTVPFTVTKAGAPEFGHAPYIATYHSGPKIESECQGGFGNEYPAFDMASKTLDHITEAPAPSGRFHVYSATYVWQYEWKFSKWHGYLPIEQRGQTNADLDGDPHVYPIPMYFAYEDYFMESYGNGNKSVDDIFADAPSKPLLLTTTHNRFRSHSTFAEVGYLREFTHRTVKGSTDNNAGDHIVVPGGIYSGDDWNEYGLCAPLDGDMKLNEGGDIPRLNKPIQYNQGNATYSEFWMNPADAEARGIEDGNLVLVSNPVGAVRVVARLSERVTPGFVGLHQGCWYDPDRSTDEWVDDGGNCNTLMAQKHSRVDHGNGQQSAMVIVTKIR